MNQANNISEYLKFLERYSSYKPFFRGQGVEYSTISSSVARDQGYLINESKFYQESLRLSPNEFENLETPLQCLSKMQHFSIPTRLIDITIDPLVALYFAVENTEEKSTGLVYVYLETPLKVSDIRVQLLSLLATINDYEPINVQNEFLKIFKTEISIDDILLFSASSLFVDYSKELRSSNERLYNQKGTFFICGNKLDGIEIKHQLRTLDEIKPISIIKIPFEHKEEIKKELDKKYGINTPVIYPELPSVSIYLKEKFRQKDFSPENKYSIIKEHIPQLHDRKIFIVIILTSLLSIEQIKSVVIYLTRSYAPKFEIVRVDVAREEKDCISNNWVLQSEWIKPGFTPNFIQFKTSGKHENGFYWVESSQYEVMQDYYDNFYFDDDKKLYIIHKKILFDCRKIHLDIIENYPNDSLDDFSEAISGYKAKIRNIYFILNDFGHSTNIQFDHYIDLFLKYATEVDNIYEFLSRDGINLYQKKKLIENSFRDCKLVYDQIISEGALWETKLRISHDDFDGFDPYTLEKKKYIYEPTLPISSDALIVFMKEEIKILEDKKILIDVQTNLYDGGELMLSIRDEHNKLLGQAKSMISNGMLYFGPFSEGNLGYKSGTYFGNISLSLPSLQSKEFVDKAGIEYEKITGNLVVRNDSSPMLNYDFSFVVI